MHIENLFPSPVAMVKLVRSLTSPELAVLINQAQKDNQGNSVSLNSSVLDDPVLIDLRLWIEQQLNAFLDEVWQPQTQVSAYITQSWTNITRQDQWHHAHAHQNSFISGTFYVQTDAEDRIHFRKEGYQQLYLFPREYNTWNSPTWWLPAESLSLLLWPSHLLHNVETKQTNGERVSLSFNSFLRGDLGAIEAMNHLNIP